MLFFSIDRGATVVPVPVRAVPVPVAIRRDRDHVLAVDRDPAAVLLDLDRGLPHPVVPNRGRHLFLAARDHQVFSIVAGLPGKSGSNQLKIRKISDDV